MADDPNLNPDNGGAAEVTRPDWLPESYFDADAKAVKADALKADLSELPTLRELKTAQETRAASLPKDPNGYKLDLPAEFKVPEGQKFAPDDKDPAVTTFRNIAKTLGLDQSQFSTGLGLYAQMMLDQQASAANADKEFVAEQTKLLGEKAPERRAAAKTWMAANLTDEQAAAFEPMLDLKVGVEAMESIMRAITGTTARGNPQNDSPDKNAELVDQIGKTPGIGRQLLDAHHAAKR